MVHNLVPLKSSSDMRGTSVLQHGDRHDLWKRQPSEMARLSAN